MLPRGVGPEEYAGGGSWAIRSWARERCTPKIERRKGGVDIVCRLGEGKARLEKRLRFEADGRITVSWQWDTAVAEPSDFFSTELSLAGQVSLEGKPEPEEWRYVIETVAKSERGFDRTRQGDAVVLRWPVEVGGASVSVRAPGGG